MHALREVFPQLVHQRGFVGDERDRHIGTRRGHGLQRIGVASRNNDPFRTQIFRGETTFSALETGSTALPIQ
jgi:hypothetical protein